MAEPNPTPPRTDLVLQYAAELIRTGGLARGRYAGPGAALCPQGAIDKAFRDLGGSFAVHGSTPTSEARAALARAASVQGALSSWSDGETDENVVAALERAAENERPELVAARATAQRRNPHEW